MLVGFLVLLEGGARLYRASHPPDEGIGYGYPEGLYTWNPFCEYGLLPGFHGFFEGEAFAAVPIDINEQGFRDDPFPDTKARGALRVVFLGDSVTFGSGVPFKDRYTNLLPRKTRDGRPLECLNLAVNSYTSFHYVQQARHEVPRWDPDVVVVGMCLNDLKEKETSWPRKWVRSPDGSYVGKYLLPESEQGFRSRDYSVFLDLWHEMHTRLKNRDAWRKWMGDLGEKWSNEELVADLRHNLEMLRDELASQNRRLIVLVLAELNDLHEPDRFALPRVTSLALLDELGIESLDVHAVFREAGDFDKLFLVGDSAHYSREGHTLLARALAERLGA
jgi:lysophospholipase L1-like esterase